MQFNTANEIAFYTMDLCCVFQCTCASCEIQGRDTNTSTSHQSGFLKSASIESGMIIPCYFNIYQMPTMEILLDRHSTVFVVNVMLWPTLIFTVGFCGLVFACLFVQRDECKWTCSLPSYFLPCSSDRLL